MSQSISTKHSLPTYPFRSTTAFDGELSDSFTSLSEKVPVRDQKRERERMATTVKTREKGEEKEEEEGGGKGEKGCK